MKITTKKPILIVFFILSSATLLRLLKITANTSSSSHSTPALPQILSDDGCSFSSPKCAQFSSLVPRAVTCHANSSIAATLSEKEFQLMSNVISLRSPCNLLVFGLGPQLLHLSNLNAGGTTMFLEDDPEKLNAFTTNSKAGGTRICKVEHQRVSGEAYKLLKEARADPACSPGAGSLKISNCQLALTKLPREVYRLKWDVVVVDGPSGDSLEAPGRMTTIYTASMIARARAGNITDVIVHDVDRTIEKWFSWEFLCDENLVSSKGKLWHFRIKGNPSSANFCSSTASARNG
nr:TPA_asm: hypothetical protein HUJ06_009402 [Nelumbo nucifera]